MVFGSIITTPVIIGNDQDSKQSCIMLSLLSRNFTIGIKLFFSQQRGFAKLNLLISRGSIKEGRWFGHLTLLCDIYSLKKHDQSGTIKFQQVQDNIISDW